MRGTMSALISVWMMGRPGTPSGTNERAQHTRDGGAFLHHVGEVTIAREGRIQPHPQVLVVRLIGELDPIVWRSGVRNGELRARHRRHVPLRFLFLWSKPDARAFRCTKSNAPAAGPFANAFELLLKRCSSTNGVAFDGRHEGEIVRESECRLKAIVISRRKIIDQIVDEERVEERGKNSPLRYAGGDWSPFSRFNPLRQNTELSLMEERRDERK